MEGGHLRLVEKEIQHLDMLNSKEINGQNFTYNVIYKQAQKKKQAIFYCQNPAPPRILPTSPSKLEINFFSGYGSHIKLAFLAPIGDTCKSHVNVHGHSDKMYNQLMATQVKYPRKSLPTEAAHGFMQDLR
jgi:hypothetical protein